MLASFLSNYPDNEMTFEMYSKTHVLLDKFLLHGACSTVTCALCMVLITCSGRTPTKNCGLRQRPTSKEHLSERMDFPRPPARNTEKPTWKVQLRHVCTVLLCRLIENDNFAKLYTNKTSHFILAVFEC